MSKKKRTVWRLWKSDRASAADENTDRGAWWMITVALIAVVGGIAVYIIGNGVNQANTGANNLMTSVSTQQGLNNLAKSAQANATGLDGNGTSSTSGGTGYTPSGNTFTAP